MVIRLIMLEQITFLIIFFNFDLIEVVSRYRATDNFKWFKFTNIWINFIPNNYRLTGQ